MSQILQVELTQQERDVLLRGLRYVRSSLMLEVREPETDDVQNRQSRLRQIASLMDQLTAASDTAKV